MRDCKLIRESLSGWLDGQLSTSDAEIIRLHLESCAPCDGERHQLEKLQSSLESLLVSNVPRIAFEPFWAGVRERITKSGVGMKKSWNGRGRHLPRRDLLGLSPQSSLFCSVCSHWIHFGS